MVDDHDSCIRLFLKRSDAGRSFRITRTGAAGGTVH